MRWRSALRIPLSVTETAIECSHVEKAASPPEVREALPGAHEGVLRAVLGQRRIPGHAGRESIDAVDVHIVERAERVRIAPLGPLHQLEVGQRKGSLIAVRSPFHRMGHDLSGNGCRA